MQKTSENFIEYIKSTGAVLCDSQLWLCEQLDGFLLSTERQVFIEPERQIFASTVVRDFLVWLNGHVSNKVVLFGTYNRMLTKKMHNYLRDKIFIECNETVKGEPNYVFANSNVFISVPTGGATIGVCPDFIIYDSPFDAARPDSIRWWGDCVETRAKKDTRFLVISSKTKKSE